METEKSHGKVWQKPNVLFDKDFTQKMNCTNELIKQRKRNFVVL